MLIFQCGTGYNVHSENPGEGAEMTIDEYISQRPPEKQNVFSGAGFLFISVKCAYTHSTTSTQRIRNSRSSALPFTDWEAATMGIHCWMYWRAVPLFLL